MTDAVSVSVGAGHTLMMNSSGHLYAAGRSTYFGRTSTTTVSYFTRIDNNSTYFTTEMQSKTIKDFSAGNSYSYILFTDGTFYGCYLGSGFVLIDSGVAMIDLDSGSTHCWYLKSDGMYTGRVSSAGVVTKTQLVSMTSTVASTVVQIRGNYAVNYGYLTSSGYLYVCSYNANYSPTGVSGEIGLVASNVAYFDIGLNSFGYVTTGGVFYRWGQGYRGAQGNGSESNVNFSAKINLTIGTTYLPTLSVGTFDISATPPA